MGITPNRPIAPLCDARTAKIVGACWLAGLALIGSATLLMARAARAVPAFAQQTGQPCKACHVGGFGPELTPFGREFKLGGYTLRAHASIPLAAMAIASVTHTSKDQNPPGEHLNRNDNVVLDQASLFVAGGVGNHFGGFAQVTYDGVARQSSWDNLDLRAVTKTKMTGFAAAAGGALVGGWLGFQTMDGLFALVTTIAGAAVGGNLLLLGLDIAWDRQARERFAAAHAEETAPSVALT